MSGVSLPRPLCGIGGDLEQIKTRQAAASACSSSSAFSLSSRTRARACALRLKIDLGAKQETDAKDSGLSFLGQRDGAGIFGEPSLHSIPTPLKRKIEEPVCLMGGVRDGLWEGDANNQYFPRKSSLRKEPSLLLSLIQEIQPLDISQISKDVSSDSTDAMKRTISGMLGLLPSDQFNVTVETSREPLAKLLVSSMMTGYTLRNAEYRLCLQRSLELSEEDERERGKDRERFDQEDQCSDGECILQPLSGEGENDAGGEALNVCSTGLFVNEDADVPESVGPITEEVKGYIQYLKQKLASVSKELEECRLNSTGLQMKNIVGEEKNDLLDYLRALEPDKVAELSQPTSSEVEDVIQLVISDLLDNPSTKLQSKDAQFGSGTNNTMTSSWEEDSPQKFSPSPLQSQSTVAVNRDYLARMLFWCMLLGHHMRGLEYRLELSRTLSLSGDLEVGLTERNPED